jgi:hypothetical protein
MDWSHVLDMVSKLIPERENVLLIRKHYHIKQNHLLDMLSKELVAFLNEQDTTPYWDEYKLDYYLVKNDISEMNIDNVEEYSRSDIFKDMTHNLEVWYSLQQKLDTWIADISVYVNRSHSSKKTHIRFEPCFDHIDPTRIRESLQYLFSRGFDINTRNKYGRTLLHEFLYNRETTSTIQHVLKMKADPNITHRYTNKTCFDMACISSYQETIISLIDHGAIIKQSNINTFIARGQSHVLRKCFDMGFDIYRPVDRFIKWNSNGYNHNILQNLNKSIDRTSIATIKILLQRQEKQFYMQVDSLWGLILSFIYPDKKRKNQ